MSLFCVQKPEKLLAVPDWAISIQANEEECVTLNAVYLLNKKKNISLHKTKKFHK